MNQKILNISNVDPAAGSLENEGLTSEEKYGRLYEVGDRERVGSSSANNSRLDCEFYELPHGSHPGLCWLALELGEPVDGCQCLKRFL